MWRSTAPNNAQPPRLPNTPSTPSTPRTPRSAPVLALLAGAIAVAVYAVVSNWLMVHLPLNPWSVAILFGPLLLALAGGAWAARQTWLLMLCALGVLLLAVVVARGGVQHINLLYVLQHAGIHLALALGFGITLRQGATPLITGLAATVHRHFTPAMQAYTRWLTGLWCAYFLGMVVLSLAIYLLAPWPLWSFFCNLLTPLFAVLLFVVEHVLRYRRHPDFERVSMRAAFEAYQQSGKRSGKPPADGSANRPAP
jgi:uncharacterized membrane protein